MGRKVPAVPAAEEATASEAPRAKSRPRSQSQLPARPALRSRRSVSQERQNESPPMDDSTFAEAGRRYVDVARVTRSPESDHEADRHSGRRQQKGKGSSPSRTRMPSIETVSGNKVFRSFIKETCHFLSTRSHSRRQGSAED